MRPTCLEAHHDVPECYRPDPRAPGDLALRSSRRGLAGSAFAGRHSTTTSTTSGDGYAYGRTSEDGHSTFEYAIVQNDDNTNCSISGDDHWDVLRKLQKEVSATKKNLFWFVKDDKGYVVRDRALVDKAIEIVKPMGEIGGEQGKLGAIQGELGRQQGELGYSRARPVGSREGWRRFRSTRTTRRAPS